jgi:uridine phosphorylase
MDVIIGKIPEGAPKAVIFIEFLYCLGVNRIIVTGAAGSLQPEVPGCSLVAMTSAIREEGTSYHYIDAAEVAQASEDLLRRFHEAADRARIKIHSGPTLTNDAPFRISTSKIKQYQKLNVLTADMELAALFAVAQCRGMDLAGLLVISDTHYGDRQIFAFSEGYRQAQTHAAMIILDTLCMIQP